MTRSWPRCRRSSSVTSASDARGHLAAEARQDLRDIVGYIAERRPAAALRLGDAIRHTADRLPDHPFMHRPGRVPGTREAIVPNYILVYRVADTIEVLAVLHARQQYP